MKTWNQIYKNNSENYTYYNLHEAHEDLLKVAKYFQKKKIKSILDLGCGVGRNLIPLAKMGFDVSGIDYADEAIKQTKSLLEENKLRASLIEGDVYKKLPYEDHHFDAIVSIQVIQHAYETDLTNAIKEIYRILKPNGYIFVTVCGRYSKGKVRPCLVKTAKNVAPHTFIPTEGNETGQVHFMYTKSLIVKHFNRFNILKIWRDSRDYYCFIAKK